MRLKINLNLGGEVKEVNWESDFQSIPSMFSYKGLNWEWLLYDKDLSGSYDYILTYSSISNPRNALFNQEFPSFDELFYQWNSDVCECAAKYDRHFPQIHSDWCKKWRPI